MPEVKHLDIGSRLETAIRAREYGDRLPPVRQLMKRGYRGPPICRSFAETAGDPHSHLISGASEIQF